MSKKLLVILALVMCLAFSLVGCNNTKATITADNSNAITTANGGFLAQTEDYVYFVNGSELYTEANEQGQVEKGALIRVKKTELSKGAQAEKEVVVSKLVATSDYAAGIAIYDGKIYFATPNNEKNKVGTVLNEEVVFCSAGLDGSNLTTIATSKGVGNGVNYRFTKVGDTVYVVFLSTETTTVDGAEVSKNYVNVVKADGTAVAKEEYASVVFEKGADVEYVYFTRSIENEVLDITESFNEVYRLKVGASAAEKVLYGAGSSRNEGETQYVGKGVQGVTFKLIAAQNGYLYLSAVSIDTSVSTATVYAALAETAGTDTEANFAGLTKLTYDTAKAEKIITATSIFEAPNKIVYVDSTKGLCVYNYEQDQDYNAYYGVTIAYYDSYITNATLAYVDGGYLYYQNGGIYYRLPYNAGVVAADAEAQEISPIAYSTAWYAPEMVEVDGKEYFLGTLSSADYHDYVVANEVLTEEQLEADVLGEDSAYEAFIKTVYTDEEMLEGVLERYTESTVEDFLLGTERENVLYGWTKVVSLLGDAAQEEVDSYIDSTYPSGEEAEEEQTEEGCGSSMTASALGLLVLAAGAFVAKKKN